MYKNHRPVAARAATPNPSLEPTRYGWHRLAELAGSVNAFISFAHCRDEQAPQDGVEVEETQFLLRHAA